jgi:hypothetical protein
METPKKQRNVWRTLIRSLITPLVLLPLAAFSGCTTYSSVQVREPLKRAKHYQVRIEGCVNRTDFQGSRDIAAEATRTLFKKMDDSGLFQISPDANYALTCDIERFQEGSAFKRWLAPGYGVTQAEVVVMVWELPAQKVLATFRSEAKVEAGGLYTIGADKYILGAAFDDIIRQLKAWVTGENP